MSSRLVGLVALAVLGAGSLAAGPADFAAATTAAQTGSRTGATVTVGSPGVTVLKKGAARFTPVSTGSRVAAGDTIQTDATGRAEVVYADGSLTRLDHDTVFTVDTLVSRPGRRQVEGTVSAGRTWNRVQALAGKRAFRQRANGVTASVLGTAFSTDCPRTDPTVLRTARDLARSAASLECAFAVVEGQVSVRGKGAAPITLTAGQRVTVDAAGAVGEVESLPPDAVYADPWVQDNAAADASSGGAPTGPVPGDALATASVLGQWDVQYEVVRAENVLFPAVGEVLRRTWTFGGECPPGGACTVTLTRSTRTDPRTGPVTFAAGEYKVVDPQASLSACYDYDTGAVQQLEGLTSSIEVVFRVTAAEYRNGVPTATALGGTVTEQLTPLAGVNCAPGTIVYEVRSSR